MRSEFSRLALWSALPVLGVGLFMSCSSEEKGGGAPQAAGGPTPAPKSEPLLPEANAALRQVGKGRDRFEARDFQGALAAFRAALPMWERIPRSEKRQADCHLFICDALLNLERPQEAIDSAKRALALFAKVPGTEIDQADCHLAMATAHHHLGRDQESLDEARAALPLYAKAPGAEAQQASTREVIADLEAALAGQGKLAGATPGLSLKPSTVGSKPPSSTVHPAQIQARVQELIKNLDSDDPLASAKAGLALGEIGPEAKDAVPALIEALKNKNHLVRYGGACGLRGIGKQASVAAAPLFKAMKDPDSQVRTLAQMALWELGPAPVESIPTFIAGLHDKAIIIQAAASEQLVKMGAAAVPALIALLGEREVQNSAQIALKEIGPPAVLGLIEALKSQDPGLRGQAAHALALFGPKAKDAVKPLQGLLNDPDLTVRITAKVAIDMISRQGGDRPADPVRP